MPLRPLAIADQQLCREGRLRIFAVRKLLLQRDIGATFHCLEERDVNVNFNKATNHKAIDLFREIAPSLVFTHPHHKYMLDHEQVHLLGAKCHLQLSNS